jgi:hypothetical protein
MSFKATSNRQNSEGAPEALDRTQSSGLEGALWIQ